MSEEGKRTTRYKHKDEKMNRTLNYLIAFVSVLIIISLGFIFMTGDEDEAIEQQTEDAAVESENEDATLDEQEDETEAEQPATDDTANDESAEDDRTGETDSDVDVVNVSDDPLVAEIWTSDAWQSYPTAQTGQHQSTFSAGHIDYEEKLQSIFSVLPIEQQDSIIWSVRNNGSTKSAIAVVSSNDKTQNYRVAIEWIDEQGWKPVQVEVLNALEGTY